mgnify:CR=1 FL=1
MKKKLKNLKTLAPDLKVSDNEMPGSPPSPLSHEASSRETQAAGFPPLPDLRLSPPPPSLLGHRAGGTVWLKHSQKSLHRYCQLLQPKLRGLTSSSCGGLWPSTKAFWAKNEHLTLFVLILGHFWCSVVTSIMFSSNLGNFGKNPKI